MKKRDPPKAATSKRPEPSKLQHVTTPSNLPAPNGTRQFAQTPHFSARPPHFIPSTARAPVGDAFSSSDVKSGFRAPLRSVESIHDASQESEAAVERVELAEEHEHHDMDVDQAYTSIENDDALHGDVISPSKRRRLSPAPIYENTTSLAAQTPKRFLSGAFPTQRHTPHFDTTASTSALPSHHRPPFLLPPALPTQSEASEPLPDAFSPHRRGKKFVPGGMAETMQGWVIDIAQDLRRNNDVHRWGPRHRDSGGGRSAVQEAASERFRVVAALWSAEAKSGMIVVRAVSLDDYDGPLGEEEQARLRNIALIRSGIERSAGFVEVLTGAILNILPPHWEIELDGESWTIGIEWRKER